MKLERKKTSMELLERVLEKRNMHEAIKRVRQNGGTFGVDKMDMEEATSYYFEHEEEIAEQIRNRKYKPSPVRRVYIPKGNGKLRGLGIPTIVDRFIQQGMLQVLQPIFDQKFSDNSFGFRPGRAAEQAIIKVLEYFNDGYDWIVDIDLEKFFDNVNHDKLISLVAKTIPDGDVVSLVRKFMQSGVMEDRLLKPTKVGTPQGGNLSPLLSNIMLNELDRELEARGLNFVRYADDCIIVVKSEKAANRVMESITKFIEKKLDLKVNMEKSKIARPDKIKYLGFGFFHKKDKWRPKPHLRSVQKFEEKLTLLTKRNKGKSVAEIIKVLNPVIRGWINYFKICCMKTIIRDISAHVRRRLRQIIWKQWKNCGTRFKNLMKLGIHEWTSRKYAWSRKGYWRMSKNPVIHLAISNKRLEKRGLISIEKYFEKVHEPYFLIYDVN